MNINSIFLFFFLLIVKMTAQEITGHVFDAKTKEPIAGVTLYYDGSTIGAITDLEGNFTIKSQYQNNAVLVVRHLGYETRKIQDAGNQGILKIALKEQVQSLNEIVVTSDPFSRKQKMKVFTLEFLGDTKGGRNSEIVNKKDIKLYFNSYNNTLSAYSDVPIIIANEYLGYRIYFEIEEFKIYFKTQSLDRIDNIHQTLYDGSTQFFDTANGDPKILKRRSNAYLGSSMHFMRACWYGNLTDQNFKLKKKFRDLQLSEFYTVQKDTVRDMKAIRFVGDNYIIYHKRKGKSVYRSTLNINEPDSVHTLDRFGNYKPFQSLVFGGYMANFRIGEMLPMDYGL
ncbi:carboxypeptidase-like regulatory domain-containing protein [Flagellimonas flava]|uniref:CarboxypepD_reg-like domain-containing protein n=1 Tax=Flagellimonas flava TaxID=570519 RepID=A0A1M5M641_9FLAO|nr:carboxypeptidase-like regulatory domain-containing protein [Allomuricauda flava]SHG72213.1 CarboxypepD_reg-like domain-containing protein [Allomuricauda flava]